jgi:Delta3-Delta2-enoyl-CoA isomerase
VIDLAREGEVWVLRMAGGENLFNRRWLEAFSGALDRVEAAGGPAALVTTGEQKFYTNGMDIEWLAAIPAEADGFLAEVGRLFGRVLGFPMATVAAINGHAFGAGAVLAVAHDVIVMREDRGYWCLPEADLGFPITPAMLAVIAAKVPRRSAQEAVLTGRRYGASEAAAAGIVHQVASEDQVLARAVQLAAELAAKDRRTLAEHKRMLYSEPIEVIGAGGA